MSHIKIIDSDKVFIGTRVPINKNTIKTIGIPKSLNGFYLCNDKNDKIIGDYSSYTTLYREIDVENNIYQYSSDGSVYVQPKYTVNFIINFGGSMEKENKQSISNYEDLVIPMPIADENYEFIGWEPEIPTSGIL